MGIGIVVPAIKILETINCTELVKFRNACDEKKRKQSVPGTDSAKRNESPDRESSTFTKEDFEAALKKQAARPPPSPRT